MGGEDLGDIPACLGRRPGVDAVYPQSFQLKFYHLQELAVETLDERNDF